MPAVKLRNNLLVILLCLAIAAFVALAIEPDKTARYHDDGLYMILAKAINEGKGLRLINLPTAPYETKYPPLYPFLLSLIWRFKGFPENILWYKLLNVALLFLILLETYFISLMLLGGKKLQSALATILLGTSASTVFLATRTLSEIPYMLFSLTAILIFLKLEGQEDLDRIDAEKYLSYSMAIFCASFAYLTRTPGLTLLLSIVIYLVIKRDYMAAAYSLALISTLNLPWILWARTHAPGVDTNPLLHYYTGYVFPMSEIKTVSGLVGYFKAVLLPNIWYLCEKTSRIISDVSALFKLLIAPVMLIFLTGVWSALPACAMHADRRDRRWLLIYIYLAIYGLMFICLPTLPSSRLRYLMPLAPFLFIIFLRGTEAIIGKINNGRVRFYFASLIIILLLPNVVVGARDVLIINDQTWDGYKETIAWIRENTDKNAVLASTYDPLYYLYTGRVGLRPWFENLLSYYYPFPTKAKPNGGDPQYCFSLLKKLNVSYLIVEHLTKEQAKPTFRHYLGMIEKHRDELKLTFVSKDGLHKIYQLSRAEDHS